MSDELLRVENLCKAFPLGGGFLEGKKRWLKAVDRVSLHLEKGETLGLVGESGSGKSTVGNLILRLLDADSGSVRFEGVDVTRLSGAELTRARARMQVVFQDPQSSLDPRMTVGNIVSLPLKILGLAKGGELRERAAASLAEKSAEPRLETASTNSGTYFSLYLPSQPISFNNPAAIPRQRNNKTCPNSFISQLQ